MPRARKGAARRQAHKRLFKQTKGYRGARGNQIRRVKEQLLRSGAFAYRDRRNRKREFRQLWIIRINAAARARGLTYSVLVNGLKNAGIELNRKMLSEIAIHDPAAFDAIVEKAQAALSAKAA